MSGDSECKKSFDYFTKPHLKYKIIQNKKWGVAMLELPDTFEEYINGQNKQLLRRKRKRAESKGYTFQNFPPLDRIDEMLEINKSMEIRQGRPMNPDYLNKEKIADFFIKVPEVYGIFDEQDVLQAYGHTPICGEVFLFNRLLGHQDHLNNGVMYMLISEVVKRMIEQKRTDGVPIWAMYDTFLGASEGLWYFKERLGFKPYTVKWVWDEMGRK